MQARRLHLQALEVRSYGQGPLQNETQCLYSTQVPKEYQGYYLHGPLQPKPRPAQPAAPEATAAAATEAAPGVPENFQANVSTHSARAGEYYVKCVWRPATLPRAATPTAFADLGHGVELRRDAKVPSVAICVALNELKTHQPVHQPVIAVSRVLGSAASAWMLPWERRQMDGAGTPLRTWEKLYWGIFVAGLAAFMFSRLYQSQPPDPKAC